jgi:hypothetical protein
VLRGVVAGGAVGWRGSFSSANRHPTFVAEARSFPKLAAAGGARGGEAAAAAVAEGCVGTVLPAAGGAVHRPSSRASRSAWPVAPISV